jgi:energy-coupling factor transporter ATP-binding protein EcfA2
VISSIEITRFRGIREGKLEDLTPLVVLVGPNGCGKSTVLDALLIGASPTPAEAVVRTVRRHYGVQQGPLWLFWRGKTQNPPEVVVMSAKGPGRRCRLNWEALSSAEQRGKEARIDCLVDWPGTPRISSKSCAATFARRSRHDECKGGTVRGLDDVSDISLIETHRDERQAPLHELYSGTTRTGRQGEARAIIAQLIPHMRDLEILTEAGTPIVYLVYEDCAVPVALSGDGIHALVRVTLELASRPRGVVLLEEPEVHQHPGAIRQTMRAVLAAVRRDIQVILTTHSLELIDALLAESSDEDLEKLSLYRLELEDGRLISVRKPGPEVAFSRTEIEKDLR